MAMLLVICFKNNLQVRQTIFLTDPTESKDNNSSAPRWGMIVTVFSPEIVQLCLDSSKRKDSTNCKITKSVDLMVILQSFHFLKY